MCGIFGSRPIFCLANLPLSERGSSLKNPSSTGYYGRLLEDHGLTSLARYYGHRPGGGLTRRLICSFINHRHKLNTCEQKHFMSVVLVPLLGPNTTGPSLYPVTWPWVFPVPLSFSLSISASAEPLIGHDNWKDRFPRTSPLFGDR